MPSSQSSRPSSQKGFRSVPYEKIQPGKPPIPITVAPPPSSARLGIHPSLRPRTSEHSLVDEVAQSKQHHDTRRDSGLAPSSSTARGSRTTFETDKESAVSIKYSPVLPNAAVRTESPPPSSGRLRMQKEKSKQVESPATSPKTPDLRFKRISTHIPTSSFEDLTVPGQVEFSNRGSMLIGGKRASETYQSINSHMRHDGRGRKASTSVLSAPSVPSERILSTDDELLSQKVRSMYENGIDLNSSLFTELHNSATGEISQKKETWENNGKTEPSLDSPSTHVASTGEPRNGNCQPQSTQPDIGLKRSDYELAGGVEDWQDIGGGDVDRYGFIIAQSSPKHSLHSPHGSSLGPIPRMQRVNTLLQLASEAPRRQRSGLGRKSSLTGSTRSRYGRKPTSTNDIRPTSSQSSNRSLANRPESRESRLRTAANRLPHNRERRLMDEAGDMLTLPPGLADIAEQEEGGRGSTELKRKEWEREEKWRKMAKVNKNPTNGGGMMFEFDTQSPKLIARTWKGIPDSWRATAWHAFLSASARKRPGSPTDDTLKACFRDLLDKNSPDDVQIDIDVPRTINSHIMFRRRYRGGQRLLFRVLHCLSIYFPEMGYVQGMAALAATLLCYFDEEMAFVMLVRMWELRGLAKLYQSGFHGLMEALDEFEKQWLNRGEVAIKLVSISLFSILGT